MESRRHALPRLLAGLQVGMLGGLLILVWFLALSQVYFRTPWALLNLFAYAVRPVEWSDSLSVSTGVGVALHLFACSLLGIFIGWLLPRPQEGDSTSLPGMAFGVIISLLVYEFLWRRMLPPLGTMIAPVPIFIAHGLFGAGLAQFPRFFLKLEQPPLEGPEERS